MLLRALISNKMEKHLDGLQLIVPGRCSAALSEFVYHIYCVRKLRSFFKDIDRQAEAEKIWDFSYAENHSISVACTSPQTLRPVQLTEDSEARLHLEDIA